MLKLTYNGISFLLTGDASSKIEQQMMKKYDATATGGNIVVTTNGISYSIQAKDVIVPNVTPEKPKAPTGNVNSGTYVIPGAPTSFKNCAAMREYYPSGVSSSHPAYAAARDGDKDGWACE